MTEHPVIIALVLASAFAVGLSVNRGSTCAVAAARDWVWHGRIGTSVGFALAVGVAGLCAVGARWLFGPVIHLAGDPAIGWPLLLGGILLGLGASLNGACMFGTLGRIGNGELRFLGMPLGLGIGFAALAWLPTLALPVATASPLASPSLPGGLVMIGFAALARWSWRYLARADVRQEGPAGYRSAMLILGVAGAAGFLLFPGASYGEAVRQSVTGVMMGYAVPVSATLAALGGTLIAGHSAGRLRLRRPRTIPFLRSVGGGMLMATGSSLIPGGNDALLLAYLPAAAAGGLVAYLVMSATVMAVHWSWRPVANA